MLGWVSDAPCFGVSYPEIEFGLVVVWCNCFLPVFAVDLGAREKGGSWAGGEEFCPDLSVSAVVCVFVFLFS